MADKEVDQESVDAVVAQLTAAVDQLEKADKPVVPEKPVVDKADLEKYYNECVSYYKEADYTADSWKAYAGALANAKAVLADQDATEEEVKAAIDELAKAAKNLVKKTTEDSKKPDKKPEDTNKTPVTGDPVTPMMMVLAAASSVIAGREILKKKKEDEE